MDWVWSSLNQKVKREMIFPHLEILCEGCTVRWRATTKEFLSKKRPSSLTGAWSSCLLWEHKEPRLIWHRDYSIFSNAWNSSVHTEIVFLRSLTSASCSYGGSTDESLYVKQTENTSQPKNIAKLYDQPIAAELTSLCTSEISEPESEYILRDRCR